MQKKEEKIKEVKLGRGHFLKNMCRFHKKNEKNVYFTKIVKLSICKALDVL